MIGNIKIFIWEGDKYFALQKYLMLGNVLTENNIAFLKNFTFK